MDTLDVAALRMNEISLNNPRLEDYAEHSDSREPLSIINNRDYNHQPQSRLSEANLEGSDRADARRPDQFRNLFSLFRSRVQTHAQKQFIFYLPGQLKAEPLSISYSEFFSRVERVAGQLLTLCHAPGCIFLLHFNTHYDNLLYFWAVTCAGFTPAMSSPSSANIDHRRAHLLHLRTLLNDPICFTRQVLAAEFSCQNALKVIPVEDLPPVEGKPWLEIDGSSQPLSQGQFKDDVDVAALMLTSGSTGHSKAVCLTHKQILKSIQGKCEALGTSSETIFFNWIGADHVACLTEMHGHGLWVGTDQVYAQAADVVADPLSFWNIVCKHRVAHTFAPNFFLASLLRALTSAEGSSLLQQTDASALRIIVTGGEANVVDTCLALSKLLQASGIPINCLKPAFGMTETCGGSIYSHLFPQHDVLQGYDFASVGKCINGMQMRVVDDDGKTLPQGTEAIGNLEVSGPVIFAQYLNNEKATKSSFRGEWFMTGDQATIDSSGQLCLTGRTKELLIINGVNYSPTAIEAALENIEGVVPSFVLVLPYRPKNAETEGLCVLYLPSYNEDDTDARESTNNAISSAVLLQVGIRPLIIPVDKSVLQKTTLGKLPRGRLSRALHSGDLDHFQHSNEDQMARHRAANFEAPSNATEQLIIDTFLKTLQIGNLQIGITTDLFAMGINSIDLIKIKQRLQSGLGRADIPTITIISNPTARGLAKALRTPEEPVLGYNPLVALSSRGSKAPLWLIHPGVGEVLIFLALASYIKDRPVYAMRARGFEAGELPFANSEEIISTYLTVIKQTQKHGPYAIAGYSFGSMIAFELAKRLRQTDEVRFLGVFNLPPHIKMRMRQLDWPKCLLHLCYFLNFFSEEYAHRMYPLLQQQTREETLQHILDVTPPERLVELGLDAAKLRNWANVAFGLQSSAVDYEPSGEVDCLDVFCAVPLPEVAKNMDDWIEKHLSKWRDFSSEEPCFHRVDGAHYTMISPTHVHTFQKTLKMALEQRGI